MKTPSLLITQCLQNDFVKRVGRYEPLPNLLHVGSDEARRLLGEDPAQGPLARVMRWAYAIPDARLRIVHIRDWHDAADPAQASHLAQFGRHCLKGTPGAAFAFPEPMAGGKDIRIVDTLTLNDFVGTNLAAALKRFKGTRARVGLLGVWTDAKISFLAYELRTRYPDLDLAVCSALCASSSRSQHFIALDQLQRLLGVKVFPSLGSFQAFLTGEAAPEPEMNSERPRLDLEAGVALLPSDLKLLRFLFRDSVSARLRRLDGGFSGNVVMGSESVDAHGHAQAPCVIKIGAVEPIGRERAAFERIEAVLGNNAPRLADFADFGKRGGLKYRYAAMGGSSSATFQKRYAAGLSQAKTRRFLDEVFLEQLGKLYQAAGREKVSLLDYYQFAEGMAPRVKPRVEAALGARANRPVLRLPGGLMVPNPVAFYADALPKLLPLAASGSATMAFVHGDLNGANIIIDGHDNVWLIDFFHTHRGHVLKDLLKLENDLLYIFTPVRSATALREGARITDALLAVADLARPLPSAAAIGVRSPEFVRAWGTVRILRSYYPALLGADRDPLQAWIGALRYAAHTLSFEESDRFQKLWALYAMGRFSAKVAERLARTGPLRVDWVKSRTLKKGRLGLTILPGRRDYGRDLKADLASLRAAGVTHLACLLALPEFHHFGVDGLLAEARSAGLAVFHLPILDQGAPSQDDMRRLASWLDAALGGGGHVVLHCVGGLGRSGLAAACFLKSRGLSAAVAVAEVRRARGARAVESRVQEDFVRGYRE